MKSRIPTPGFLAGEFDVGRVCIEGDVLSHDDSVHSYRVAVNQFSKISRHGAFPVSFRGYHPCPPFTYAFRGPPPSFPAKSRSKSSVSTAPHTSLLPKSRLSSKE